MQRQTQQAVLHDRLIGVAEREGTRREPSAGFTRVTRKAVRSVIHSWPSGPHVTSHGLARPEATARLVNVSAPVRSTLRGFWPRAQAGGGGHDQQDDPAAIPAAARSHLASSMTPGAHAAP